MPATEIKSFTREYAFLSNFYKCHVPYEGIDYPTSEHAFQAAKTPIIRYRQEIAELATPMQAKHYGRAIPNIRKDWDEVRIDIMLDVCLIKFSIHPDLKEKLLATGEAHLEESNTWGDRFWGTVNGKGANHLGFCLMDVRAKLREIPDPTGFSPRRRKLKK